MDVWKFRQGISQVYLGRASLSTDSVNKTSTSKISCVDSSMEAELKALRTCKLCSTYRHLISFLSRSKSNFLKNLCRKKAMLFRSRPTAAERQQQRQKQRGNKNNKKIVHNRKSFGKHVTLKFHIHYSVLVQADRARCSIFSHVHSWNISTRLVTHSSSCLYA